MVDFTVAIPTYNGAQRLPQLLNKLKQQTGKFGTALKCMCIIKFPKAD